MIDVSLVTERFLLIASLSQADEIIQSVCQTSANKIQSLLREDADDTDDRLINAAACDAFYQWTLINRATDTDALKSFRAGDITVEGDLEGVTETALRLRNEAFGTLADLLDDKGFYFGEVLIDDIGQTL